MKRRHQALLSWSDRLSIFASRFDSVATCAYRIERAREEIEELKQLYTHRSMAFIYRGETIRGEFLGAIEGDFPGTYMVVLKIASSRICSGPCFLRIAREHVGGIAVTGSDGVVGITARATGHNPLHKRGVLTWLREAGQRQHSTKR